MGCFFSSKIRDFCWGIKNGLGSKVGPLVGPQVVIWKNVVFFEIHFGNLDFRIPEKFTLEALKMREMGVRFSTRLKEHIWKSMVKMGKYMWPGPTGGFSIHGVRMPHGKFFRLHVHVPKSLNAGVKRITDLKRFKQKKHVLQR